MKRFAVYGKVYGTKYLGTFEAESPERAEEIAMTKNGGVSLCHQCSREIGDPEISECFAEEVSGE